jgi:hypothetical protein
MLTLHILTVPWWLPLLFVARHRLRAIVKAERN